MFVEVATAGDPEETAWFIYHEKPGGGYCPGSEIAASKLQAMKEVIIDVEKLGFVIVDIINHGTIGKEQKLIAYLPNKACYIDVNLKDGKLVYAEVVGQLRMYTLVESGELKSDWSNFYMACSSTRISEEYISVTEQGYFTLSTTVKFNVVEWLSAIGQFLNLYKEDISECFVCSHVFFLFAKHCLCGSIENSYDKKTATAINKSIAGRFPSAMFADDVKKVTKVR